MTKCYYYISAPAGIDESTIIYQVGIGTSQQANRDFLYLTARAVDNGDYFAIKSEDSASFVARVLDYHGCLMRRINARDLVRDLKRNLTPEPSEAFVRNRAHMLYYLSLNYRTAHVRQD